MFMLPTLAVFSPLRGTSSVKRLTWIFFGILFTLIIGFRYQVGADWGNYIDNHNEIYGGASLSEVIGFADPAYALLNWLSNQVGGSIYLVNLVCGAIVMVGVIIFSRRQPLPWLAMIVAVPYILIVVAMGYTRQSAALGFELLGLVALMDGRIKRFVIFVTCSALFHKSAILLLPLAIITSSSNRILTLFWVSITGLVLGLLLLVESQEYLITVYYEQHLTSEGSGIRVVMNALPAALLLFFRRRLIPVTDDGRLWFWLAVISLAFIPLIGLSSTAVDRIALYFMPIQLYVFSRIHWLFNYRLYKTIMVVSVVLIYGMVQWVWLNYANHASSWLPYQSFPFI